jgi:hypothetical protein
VQCAGARRAAARGHPASVSRARDTRTSIDGRHAGALAVATRNTTWHSAQSAEWTGPQVALESASMCATGAAFVSARSRSASPYVAALGIASCSNAQRKIQPRKCRRRAMRATYERARPAAIATTASLARWRRINESRKASLRRARWALELRPARHTALAAAGFATPYPSRYPVDHAHEEHTACASAPGTNGPAPCSQ